MNSVRKQKLAKIMFDAPVELTKIPEFKVDPERIIAGLKRFEFNSLVRKYGDLKAPAAPVEQSVEVKPLP